MAVRTAAAFTGGARAAGWQPVRQGAPPALRPARGRVPALAVGLVIVALPFGDTSVPLLGLSLTYVAMLVPAALAVRALVWGGASAPASIILLGLGLGSAAAVVSFAGGVQPPGGSSLVVLAFLSLGYAVGLAFAYRPGIERDALDLLVLVGGTIAVVALSSAGSFQVSDGGTVVGGRLTGPFAQPNELGVFCAALLPIAVACLVTTRSRGRLVVTGLATAALAVAWAMSMSRGAWIGGLCALVCLAICEPRTRRALAGVGAAVAATCLTALIAPANTALLGVIGARLRSLGDPSQNQYDARPLIWQEAWRQATEQPWLGVGPGGFPVAASDSVSPVSAYGADHPHDLLLTILAERGMVGLASGAIVVAGCALVARRIALSGPRLDEDGSVLRTRSMAVIAALVAVAIHGVFDMPLRNPIVAGLIWTLLGMAIVAETAHARERRPSARSRSTGPPPPRRAEYGSARVAVVVQAERERARWRSTVTLAGGLAVLLSAGTLVILLIPTTYTATSMIALRPRTTDVAADVLELQAHEYSVALSSRELVPVVARAEGFDAEGVNVSADVTRDPSTGAVRIAATSPAPGLSVAVANGLAARAESIGAADAMAQVVAVVDAGPAGVRSGPPRELYFAALLATVALLLAGGVRLIRERTS